MFHYSAKSLPNSMKFPFTYDYQLSYELWNYTSTRSLNQSPGYHIRFHGYLIGDMVVFLTCSSMYCLSAPHGWTCMGLYLYIHMREQKDTHLTNITLVPKPDMDMRRAFACTMLLAAMSPLSASSKVRYAWFLFQKTSFPQLPIVLFWYEFLKHRATNSSST